MLAKSLVATIRADGPGSAERSFRYAPLSSGLDIVRKTLSQHEIATVRTTAIEQIAGIVNLTTVLAHMRPRGSHYRRFTLTAFPRGAPDHVQRHGTYLCFFR